MNSVALRTYKHHSYVSIMQMSQMLEYRSKGLFDCSNHIKYVNNCEYNEKNLGGWLLQGPTVVWVGCNLRTKQP